MKPIDLNCDLGESFGSYTCGMDEELLPYITSANVACGFHASDPVVMQKTVQLAKKNNVRMGSGPQRYLRHLRTAKSGQDHIIRCHACNRLCSKRMRHRKCAICLYRRLCNLYITVLLIIPGHKRPGDCLL